MSEDELKDDAAKRLLELAHKKQARHEDVVETAAPRKGAEVIDIMTVLQRSLGQARAQTAKRSKAEAKGAHSGRKQKLAKAATKRA